MSFFFCLPFRHVFILHFIRLTHSLVPFSRTFIIRITRRHVSFNRSNRTLSNWNENKIENLHFLCIFAGNPNEKRKCSSWFLEIYASICKIAECDVSVKRATHTNDLQTNKKTNCLAKQMDLKIGKEFPIKMEHRKKMCNVKCKARKTARKMQSPFSHTIRPSLTAAVAGSARTEHVVNVNGAVCTVYCASPSCLRRTFHLQRQCTGCSVHLSDYAFGANLF